MGSAVAMWNFWLLVCGVVCRALFTDAMCLHTFCRLPLLLLAGLLRLRLLLVTLMST